MASDSSEKHADIFQALAAAYHDCGYVQKHKGKEGGVNYTYAGEAAILKEVRPALVKHGIIVFPAEIREIKRETYQTVKGATMNLIGVHVRYVFAHESGTELTVESYGEGADVGDKAAGKALTIAYKYALRNTLAIETGDDPDDTPSAGQERANGHRASVDTRKLAALLDAAEVGNKANAIADVTGDDPSTLTTQKAVAHAVELWALNEHISGDIEQAFLDAVNARRQEVANA